jgi:hypothetical protein
MLEYLMYYHYRKRPIGDRRFHSLSGRGEFSPGHCSSRGTGIFRGLPYRPLARSLEMEAGEAREVAPGYGTCRRTWGVCHRRADDSTTMPGRPRDARVGRQKQAERENDVNAENALTAARFDVKKQLEERCREGQETSCA